MKKHLLLILALLAFVLPARAATELLFNFTQNSNGSDQGTSFSNNDNVTAVISDVSEGDTHNVTDYVASLTNVSYAYYNSKGGLHLGPNGTVTVNLKNTYKVVKYEVMGPAPTQHSIVNTSATVTVNDHTYTGVNAAGSVNWNRVQYEPTATENVSSFTIKAGNTDVYIKSIHIYLEAEDTPTPATLSVNLATGTYKLPQTVTITSSKADDDIIVILTDENEVEVVNNIFTGSWTYNFTTPGTFALSALNNDESTISEIYEFGYAPETPVFSKDNGAYTSGTEITVSSKYATQLAVKVIKKADYDANGFSATGTQTIYDADSHTLTLSEDVVIVAQGKNDFGTTSTDYRIYTISNPVKPNVAPVITFSHEDQKVFGSEEEIDVTLSLNPDVYPIPEVIYYTLDGFMAHNTLETGNPGATPAGHVLEAAVDPTSLSTVVRIERSHREALNHRAVTINAYAFNTAGSDVAAATYIFNDNAAPLPDPEPTTITATVTMANQGWIDTTSPYTNASTVVNWNSTLADGSEGPNFSTKATAGGPKYYGAAA